MKRVVFCFIVFLGSLFFPGKKNKKNKLSISFWIEHSKHKSRCTVLLHWIQNIFPYFGIRSLSKTSSWFCKHQDLLCMSPPETITKKGGLLDYHQFWNPQKVRFIKRHHQKWDKSSKPNPGCLGCRGDMRGLFFPPREMGIINSQYKDPY